MIKCGVIKRWGAKRCPVPLSFVLRAQLQHGQHELALTTLYCIGQHSITKEKRK